MTPVSFGEAKRSPRDAVGNAGSVETALTSLLSDGGSEAPRATGRQLDPERIRRLMEDLKASNYETPSKDEAPSKDETQSKYQTNFYLYFPEEEGARRAAAKARSLGLEVEVRLGADDENWLCLASQDLTFDESDAVEERLVELAGDLGGEFDGMERATTPSG
ncbi:MAG TPA: ribonuclease E inhibitor RraB [Actinomycetota bacterium]|nr:ribonuclease E inhibitor RraB [Actinomycetota bacterium]